LQGCFDYQDVDFKGVKNVSLLERTEDKLKIQVDVLVDNPNTFNIKVKKSTLDIYLNGKYVGKTSLDDKIVLKKNKEDVYFVVLNANTREIMKAAMGSIGGLLKGEATIGLKGKVKGSVYGITKSVDIDMAEKINLKDFL
jgi:LEA14-like dessication related protein